MNFVFGGDTPWTYEQLQRRRQIADAMMAQTGSPQNVGEGLSAIGRALMVRGINRRGDLEETRLRDEYEDLRDAAFGGLGGMGGDPAYVPPDLPGVAEPPAGGAPLPPVTTSPLPDRIYAAVDAVSDPAWAMHDPDMRIGPPAIGRVAAPAATIGVAQPVTPAASPGVVPLAAPGVVPAATQPVMPGTTHPVAPGMTPAVTPSAAPSPPPVATPPLSGSPAPRQVPGWAQDLGLLLNGAVTQATGGAYAQENKSRPVDKPEQPRRRALENRTRDAAQSNFPASLIESESGGSWGALNGEGYGGRLQFGTERLADAARAGVVPAGLTGADFSRMSPQQQMAVEQWHFADIDRQAQARGLTDFIGRQIGGITITQDAIRAMAHLGGIGGAERFLRTGGAYNPSDSNGTSLSDYAMAHGGGGGAGPSGGGMMTRGQGGSFNLAALAEVMGSPFASAGERFLAQSLIQQQLSLMDPMAQMQLAQMQMEMQQMQNPQGQYSVLSPAEVLQLGLPPGAYQRGPNGQISTIGGGGVTVNTGDAGQQVGTIPSGYAIVPDPNSPAGYTMHPIPGGPEDRSGADAAAAQRETDEASVVLQQIEAIRGTIGSGSLLTGDMPEVGVWGERLGRWGVNQEATDTANRLETLKSAVAFDRLQAMRDASPTGGALGAVSDMEMGLLQSSLGSLDPTSSPEVILQTLDTIAGIMQKFAAYPSAGEAPAGPQTLTYNPQTGMLE